MSVVTVRLEDDLAPMPVAAASPAATGAGRHSFPTPPRASLAARLSAALAAPLLLAVIFQNIANFAFHAVVGRTLDAGQYGALGAVLAVMVLLSVPLMALQAAASAMVANARWDSVAVRSTLRRTAVAAVGVGVVVAMLTPVIQGFFRLGSALDAAILAPFVAVSVVLAVARGLLLGDGQVRATASTYVVGTIARFVLGVALVLPFGVTGALVGTLLGEVAALVSALPPVRRRLGSSPSAAHLGLRSVLVSGAAVTGLFLFSTVDLLLARHFLPDAATGSYVAAATIGKTVLALPAAVIGVYFPRLVSAWAQGRAGELRRAVLVVCGLAVLGAAAVAIAPRLLLTVLYGAGSFPDAVDLVRILAIVAALTSAVSILTYAALARRSWSVIVPWCGAVLEVALIVMHHVDASDVARASLTSLVPTLAVIAAWEGGAWWRAARASSAAAPASSAATAPGAHEL